MQFITRGTYEYCKIKGVTEDAGRIGLVIVISGMAGSMVCGIVLDKTHKYKVISYFKHSFIHFI